VLRNDARTLTRYNAWANELIFAAVAALPEGEATKPRRSVTRKAIRRSPICGGRSRTSTAGM
jgi:uncharacterized damage-inducible protein DinB